MEYKIGWLVPERVIEVLLPRVCDDAFMKAIDVDLNAMLRTTSQSVSVLYDVREVQKSPSAQSAFNMTYYKQRNLARILTIGLTSNPILRFLGSLIGRGIGIQVKDFTTMEEVRVYLASIEKI
jgi:hypothetical protein